MTKITCSFLDIGGVILSDGWNLQSRKLAASNFYLNFSEMEERHRINFTVCEEGRMTLTEYLDRLVFYRKRTFSKEEFEKFVFDQSKPFPKMLNLLSELKKQHGLKIIVVSNEVRELNEYRINTFKLSQFVDAFISSCYVNTCKPDLGIFKLALDIAQVPPAQILYLENTPLFVD
jgi:putative hydrolase of the HAD superfamily